jgi:hypothetical protein
LYATHLPPWGWVVGTIAFTDARAPGDPKPTSTTSTAVTSAPSAPTTRRFIGRDIAAELPLALSTSADGQVDD